MAIDKSLPEPIRTNISVTGQEMEREIPLQEEQQKGPVEVNQLDDGGVEIDFDPNALAGPGSAAHDENLAYFLEEGILNKISADIRASYDDFKASRDDWEQAYTKGLDLLGFKYEDRSEPFSGASGATHPVLAEAVTQFQALAYKELLPAHGPVRTKVVGKIDRQREEQAQRVNDFMNYQIICEIKEYEPEFDQMLFNLPLSGSTFKKVYYDSVLQRCVSKFIPAEDLLVPYSATSLDEADTIIHRIRMSGNDIIKYQLTDFYRDVDLKESSFSASEVKESKDELEGISASNDEIYTILECHLDLDLDGFQDIGQQGEATGLKLPYIVTIEEGSGQVLAIRRNFAAQDPMKTRKDYFVHFKFLPGLGFYGFGLIHMIGGLSRTATAALRQLLDAGTLANLPAGFKQRGIRVRDEAQPLQPGEFRTLMHLVEDWMMRLKFYHLKNHHKHYFS